MQSRVCYELGLAGFGCYGHSLTSLMVCPFVTSNERKTTACEIIWFVCNNPCGFFQTKTLRLEAGPLPIIDIAGSNDVGRLASKIEIIFVKTQEMNSVLCLYYSEVIK